MTSIKKEVILKKEVEEKVLLDFDVLTKILTDSIDILYEQDQHLIVQNLAERAIAHMLAVHMTKMLSEQMLHVDCEYNGDIKGTGLRKTIWVLETELQKIRSTDMTEEEWRELSVFPDIILHRRGTNLSNNLIIEIKKNYGQKVEDDFDKLKLKSYTAKINDRTPNRNHLNYRLGAYIEFDTFVKTPRKSFRIQYYVQGEPFGKVVSVKEQLPSQK